jgi:tetratricopeptide (TPR) repeat protein
MSDDAALDAFRRGDNAEVVRLAEHELETARATADTDAEIHACCALARVAVRAGRHEDAMRWAQEAIRAAGDTTAARRQMPFHILAATARLSGDLAEAARAYRQCIELDENLDDNRMRAVDVHNLGFVLFHLGDVRQARVMFDASDSPDGWVGPQRLLSLAICEFEDGHIDAAAELVRRFDATHAEAGTVADPDDALERQLLGERLASGGHGSTVPA